MKALFSIPKISVLQLFFALILAAGCLLVPACSPCYQMTSVEKTEKINTNLPALMQKASNTTYESVEAQWVLLKNDIDSAIDAAKAVKRNKDVAEMWRIFRDEQVNVFAERWKEKGKLDKDFVKEYTNSVKKSLASILRAEKEKRKCK